VHAHAVRIVAASLLIYGVLIGFFQLGQIPEVWMIVGGVAGAVLSVLVAYVFDV
jgi:hypothetical protein